MQSTPNNSPGFRPARRRTFSIAAVFDKKKDDLSSSAGQQEASKAASVIETSPIPTSPVEKQTFEFGGAPIHKQGMPDTPPASPQSSFPNRRPEQLTAETRHQRYNRPQTPMDFTFQSMGFQLGNSRASIDDVRSQLVVVKDELKSLQEKLAQRDSEIKRIRSQLDQMMEIYEQAIVDIEKTSNEKDELKDQVQRLRNAWMAERDARKALEEEIGSRLDKERQLQARIRRMSAQDSMNVLARARRPGVDQDQMPRFMDRSRRGTVHGPSSGGSFPFNQSSPRSLEL